MSLRELTAALLDAARHEFTTLIASVPAKQRNATGELTRWSPKDELAHLVYWLELYAAKLQALRNGHEPEDVRNYQARNDATWPLRRDWTWEQVERAWLRALDDVAGEWEQLEEPAQRKLMRSLIYELVDHPHHHYVRLYGKFRQPGRGRALLARTQALLEQRGAAQWTATTRKKLKRWALDFPA